MLNTNKYLQINNIRGDLRCRIICPKDKELIKRFKRTYIKYNAGVSIEEILEPCDFWLSCAKQLTFVNNKFILEETDTEEVWC